MTTLDRPLRIILADLRHETAGRHSACFPLAIGFVSEFTKAHLGADRVEISLHTDGHSVFDIIERDRPDVVGTSNYCWNAELSCRLMRFAKEVVPGVVCISGGPEFPKGHDECREYLMVRPEIDFFAYQEGEAAFAGLMEKLLSGLSVEDLKRELQTGLMALPLGSSDLTVGPPADRVKDMDIIPSPYLSGALDAFFDGSHMPFVQTARGCPFQCTYCAAGEEWYRQIGQFSVERVEGELLYISERMKDCPEIPLALSDSNFGILKRDEEIADYMATMQQRFSWPGIIKVDTAKGRYDQVIGISEKLDRRLTISLSTQSFNEATHDAVRRKNLQITHFAQVAREARERGVDTSVELIVPLPLETKESFFEGVRIVVNAGVERWSPFTTMMLKGTELASLQAREEYGLETKYRVLPRQFGDYRGEKCFEVEEVCIATNTMPFDDYLECRGFSFVASLFSHAQFDTLSRCIYELDLDRFEYLVGVWNAFKGGSGPLSRIYRDMVGETADELFEYQEAIQERFSEPDMYAALLRGEVGDNLFRKYTTAVWTDSCAEAIELGFEVVLSMAESHADQRVPAAIQAVALWTRTTRDLSSMFRLSEEACRDKPLDLEFDVRSWYESGMDGKPLTHYSGDFCYVIRTDEERVRREIEAAKRLYGGGLDFWVPRLLENTPVSNFWRRS